MNEKAGNVVAADELAERFRELGRLFAKFTSHSDEPLSAIIGYVDEDLPWQAGSYLCEAFDLGIIDSRSPQGTSVGCDLRYISPLWCRDRLKAKGLPPLKPRPKINPNVILDGETAEGVQLLAERCEEYPQDLRRRVDKQARIESWWRFITKRLAEDDRSRIRLGITLDDHKPLLEIFDGNLKKFEPDVSNPEGRFCVETSEEKARYRLRKSARIQEVACEMLAEMLDLYVADSAILDRKFDEGVDSLTPGVKRKWPMEPESSYSHGPVEGQLKEISEWLGLSDEALRNNNGNGSYMVCKEHRTRYKCWFKEQKKFAEINAKWLAAKVSNPPKDS
jgi:hypothetical protein